ncbi:MAG TPA: DUF308 domain-containing protein [Casimicrobiaceae bacterium]|nr:DUF308 domain-containing protein [Casimicrobiaceae bacterium]
MNRPTTPSPVDTDVLERETGFGWGWFMVLGAALIVLGALAFLNLPPAGATSVYAVGIFMLIGAFAQLGTTLLVPAWRGIGLLALSAVLYGTAGIFAIVNPTLAATALSLLLALGLLFSGIARIVLTAVMPPLPRGGWVGISGCVSAVTGLILIYLSLGNTVWLSGMALAVDLTLQGAMAVGFALGLKANARATSSSITNP